MITSLVARLAVPSHPSWPQRMRQIAGRTDGRVDDLQAAAANCVLGFLIKSGGI